MQDQLTNTTACASSASTTRLKKPDWLRVKLPIGESYKNVRGLVDNNKLHTICESGNCPNMGECWGEGTATFMILGNICTRSCGFCAVATGRPEPVDWDEPQRVAEAIHLMTVKHAVITSVDRDELKDGGSIIWYNTIKAVKALNPGTTLETLIPDFKGELENIQRVIDAAPEVVSHNIETVERLTKQVRIQAKYRRSMDVLRTLKEGGMRTKSGLMLGIGETKEEVIEAFLNSISQKYRKKVKFYFIPHYLEEQLVSQFSCAREAENFLVHHNYEPLNSEIKKLLNQIEQDIGEKIDCINGMSYCCTPHIVAKTLGITYVQHYKSQLRGPLYTNSVGFLCQGVLGRETFYDFTF